MPKPVNCFVPGCFNNFRNSTALQYYRIPKDSGLRTEYVRLIRNKTLKLNSDNTRICSEHFEGGRKMNPDNLLSIFPWTKAKGSRRQLIRKEPLQRQNLQQSEPSAMEMETTTTNINKEPFTVLVDDGTQCSAHKPSFVDPGTQTEVFDFIDIKQHESTILELNHTIKRLTKEVNQLNHQLKEFRFDIDNFKDSASDISFYTGFSDYEKLMLCYSIVEESSKNLNYGSYVKHTDDGKIGDFYLL
ncbi:THAP domain-containing protein 11-like [Acropora muricata]|uniref:THAP domain-containing protein 11-like n=1 Tax=Acropora muricata TaxID=159855 RepID=UPI0034E60B1B